MYREFFYKERWARKTTKREAKPRVTKMGNTPVAYGLYTGGLNEPPRSLLKNHGSTWISYMSCNFSCAYSWEPVINQMMTKAAKRRIDL